MAAAVSSNLSYPPEHKHFPAGLAGSIGFHCLVIGIILLLAYIFKVKSLMDLLGVVAVAQPPPPQIEVILDDDKTPPPPTDHPEFIIQKIIIPPPPVVIPPKPKPKPHPHPIIQRAPQAPRPAAPAKLVVGSGNFPAPDYPPEAERARMQGTVVVQVQFDSSGSAGALNIEQSSGFSALDNSVRHTILGEWHDPAFAGRTELFPSDSNCPVADSFAAERP